MSDFHLLFFVANFLDMENDMPVFCRAVADGDSDSLEGYRVMLNALAEID